jgi:hypothetical protein
MGTFCLYQGDLSVDENQKSAQWLLKEVFNDLEIPLVIAGKEPAARLIKLAHTNTNCCLIANPTQEEMQDMISKAHIHVIPSFNATGIKLKLVNALYNGKHCVVNNSTVAGTGLEEFCYIASDANSFKTIIKQRYKEAFTSGEIEQRRVLLNSMFNNDENAKQVVNWIWS